MTHEVGSALVVAEDPAIRALARAAIGGLVDAIVEASLTELRTVAATSSVDLVIVISQFSRSLLLASLSDRVALERCVVVTTVGDARRAVRVRRSRLRDRPQAIPEALTRLDQIAEALADQ